MRIPEWPQELIIYTGKALVGYYLNNEVTPFRGGKNMLNPWMTTIVVYGATKIVDKVIDDYKK